MTITYTNKAICATIENGKVNYYIEYSDETGKIIYTKRITEKQVDKIRKEMRQ